MYLVRRNKFLILLFITWPTYNKRETQSPNALCAGHVFKRSGFKTWPDQCVVFLSMTPNSHSTFLYPGV